MSLAGNFRRTVEVLVKPHFTGAEVRAYIAAEAERNIADLIRTRRAVPIYRRYTNGVENLPYDQINFPGSINIEFSSIQIAVGDALDFCQRKSPEGATGEYARRWIVVVDGSLMADANLRDIPQTSQIAITNFSDFHRKLDVGGLKLKNGVAPQIIEQARQYIMRKYPSITAQRIFITLPDGYVLKGRQRSSGLHFNKKTKQFEHSRPSRVTDRKDSREGQQMTYPALILTQTG
jgi:hypothetical protein